MDDKNIELEVDVTDNKSVYIDETLLLLVIKNIIQNAIVYTPNNTKVTIKQFFLSSNHKLEHDFGTQIVKPYLKNKSSSIMNPVVLQVMDSGIGINPKDYASIFEPFVRLSQADNQMFTSKDRSDGASKKNYSIEGTGLGLSIVKTICEQSGIGLYLTEAQCDLDNTNGHSGLCVTLII
ncbi:HAMP domain-containing sensor histidine kinase [Psychrobacter sp. H8-1]|uniref:sensor histidine kinase n=1 Tax=Psychrobacter sp. H8-1 TaxID=2774129 RepID=UPI00191A1B74|nr:ATP-binding protein [Psychrobacter sp. H8-1]